MINIVLQSWFEAILDYERPSRSQEAVSCDRRCNSNARGTLLHLRNASCDRDRLKQAWIEAHLEDKRQPLAQEAASCTRGCPPQNERPRSSTRGSPLHLRNASCDRDRLKFGIPQGQEAESCTRGYIYVVSKTMAAHSC